VGGSSAEDRLLVSKVGGFEVDAERRRLVLAVVDSMAVWIDGGLDEEGGWVVEREGEGDGEEDLSLESEEFREGARVWEVEVCARGGILSSSLTSFTTSLTSTFLISLNSLPSESGVELGGAGAAPLRSLLISSQPGTIGARCRRHSQLPVVPSQTCLGTPGPRTIVSRSYEAKVSYDALDSDKDGTGRSLGNRGKVGTRTWSPYRAIANPPEARNPNRTKRWVPAEVPMTWPRKMPRMRIALRRARAGVDILG